MFVLRVRTTALQYMRYIRNVHETPFAYLLCVVRRTGQASEAALNRNEDLTASLSRSAASTTITVVVSPPIHDLAQNDQFLLHLA